MTEDLSTEKTLLGALIVNSTLVPQAAAILAPEDFRSAELAILYADILKAHKNGKVDAVLLGRPQLVSALVAGVPRALNVSAWAESIKAESTKRGLLALLIATEALARNGDDIFDTLNQLASEVVNLARAGRRSGWLSNVDLAKKAVVTIERRIGTPDGLVGLSTGLRELDVKLGGMRPGQLIGIGGRPGAGKTALLQQIAKHVSLKQHVGFISLEMSGDELTEREILSEAEVNIGLLSWHADKSLEMGRIAKAAGAAMRENLHKVEGTFTLPEIESLATEAATRWKIAALFIDYFQLIQTSKDVRRHEALADVCRGIKGMAMRLKIPVVMALQLNRSPEGRKDRKPSLGDLAESDSPAKDCHSVILLHQDSERETASLIVDKNRSGFSGVAQCRFVKEYARFVDEAQ